MTSEDDLDGGLFPHGRLASSSTNCQYLVMHGILGGATIMRKFIAAAATTLLMSAGTAYANTVTLSGIMTVTLSSFDGNLPTIATAPTDIKTFNPNQNPTSTNDPVFGTLKQVSKTNGTEYTSNISQPVPSSGIETFNLMQIDPAGSCGKGCTTDKALYGDKGLIDSGTITVSIAGTGADSGDTFTDSGIFTAKYSGATLSCASSDSHSKNQTDCIDWAKPTIDTFTAITISLVNAVDWDLVPQVQLSDPGDSLGTPLPGALSLFAGGLGAMGLFGRRRKRKAVSAKAA